MLSLLICCLLWQEILEPTLYHPSYDPETIHKAVFGFAQGPSASGRKLQTYVIAPPDFACMPFWMQFLTDSFHSVLCLLLPYVTGHLGAHSIPPRAGPRDDPQGHLRLRPGPVRQWPQAADLPAGASSPLACMHSSMLVTMQVFISTMVCGRYFAHMLLPAGAGDP